MLGAGAAIVDLGIDDGCIVAGAVAGTAAISVAVDRLDSRTCRCCGQTVISTSSVPTPSVVESGDGLLSRFNNDDLMRCKLRSISSITHPQFVSTSFSTESRFAGEIDRLLWQCHLRVCRRERSSELPITEESSILSVPAPSGTD